MNPTTLSFASALKFLQYSAALVCVIPAVGNGATVDLGAASNFAVLAGTAITNTGATAITGDIGTFSGTAVTGIGAIALIGTDHGGDSTTEAAHASLLTAFNAATALPADVTYDPITDLGGTTLTPGVYFDPSSFAVTGILTLDGLSDPDASWVFQMGSTLTTSVGSRINLINGAKASNVLWKVGSAATLGTGSTFAGTILAWDAISFGSGAVLEGKALAYNGAVTMISNVVIPEPTTSGLACLIMMGGILRRRR